MSVGDTVAGIISVTDECRACDHCVSVCPTGAISGALGRRHQIDYDKCINCGQCLVNCPFDAITDVSMIPQVNAALQDSTKTVVVQTAPSVRVALAEEFGYPPGTNAMGRMFAALRKLGFDKVYDTNFAADLTIVEEGTELIHRVFNALGVAGYEESGPLPQFTSCCPAWVKYAEDNWNGVLPHLSSAKSPQQMFGAMAKTYGAEKIGVSPADMVVVSVMPCTAKKYECDRPEFTSSGYQDVDYSLTTRELAQMMKTASIDYDSLDEEDPDSILGESTGAAVIFGVTGGVMEAALRTAYEVLSGQKLEKLEFQSVRGLDSVREAVVEVPIQATGQTLPVSVCIVTGTAHVDPIVKEVLAGNSPYHFIEVMNCPGGCINGGGQPIRRDA